jgi:hypothetical protein
LVKTRCVVLSLHKVAVISCVLTPRCRGRPLSASKGKRAKASEILVPIYGWCTEGFDTADIQEAEVLLEELS